MLKVILVKYSLFFFISILFSHTPLFSQIFNYSSTSYSKSYLYSQDPKDDSLKTMSCDFTNYKHSVGKVLSSPLNWTSSDFIKVGGFVAISAGSFLLDQEVNKIFIDNRSETLDKLEPIGYFYGSPVSTFPSALAMYFSGVVFENNWLRKTGLMLTETITLIGIIQIPSRIIFGRARPYIGENNNSFVFLSGLKQERASFISGHAAIAFGMSNILSHQIDNPLATIGLYGLAALTPIARLYDNKHWFSDIIIGTALGIIISNKIIELNENERISNSNFSISPTLNGFAFTYRF